MLKNFIDLLCVELRHALSVKVEVLDYGLYIQSESTSEIIHRVSEILDYDESTCVLGIRDESTQEFKGLLRVYRRSAHTVSPVEILCFRKIEDSMEGSTYATDLMESLSKGRSYLHLDGSYISLYPSKGVYTAYPDRQSIAICTPCFKRLDLLNVYCQYMTTYFMPQMVWSGYDVCLILCGGDEEKDAVTPFLSRSNVLFFTHENNLGMKKNLMFNFAKDVGFDYVTTIDSDDFVHPETTVDLICLASQNGKWSAIESFYFRDIETGKSGLFEGYPHSHQLHKWGMGSARVFTRAALTSFGDSPFGSGNKSMDDAVKSQLAVFDLDWESRLISSEDCASSGVKIPIGIKSSINIWGMKSYKTTALDPKAASVSWLPPEIQFRIDGLRQSRV